MNSAFDDKHAGRERGRLMRHAVRASLACALIIGSCGSVLAQQNGERGERDGGAPERHGERFRLPPMEREQRMPEARGYDEGRRMQSYPQQYQQPPQSYSQPQAQQYERDERRGGRMTADERREMRRQINETKDLYPQRR